MVLIINHNLLNLQIVPVLTKISARSQRTLGNNCSCFHNQGHYDIYLDASAASAVCLLIWAGRDLKKKVQIGSYQQGDPRRIKAIYMQLKDTQKIKTYDRCECIYLNQAQVQDTIPSIKKKAKIPKNSFSFFSIQVPYPYPSLIRRFF